MIFRSGLFEELKLNIVISPPKYGSVKVIIYTNPKMSIYEKK